MNLQSIFFYAALFLLGSGALVIIFLFVQAALFLRICQWVGLDRILLIQKMKNENPDRKQLRALVYAKLIENARLLATRGLRLFTEIEEEMPGALRANGIKEAVRELYDNATPEKPGDEKIVLRFKLTAEIVDPSHIIPARLQQRLDTFVKEWNQLYFVLRYILKCSLVFWSFSKPSDGTDE